jgi:S-adenosylmethionine:tRNA ribosyltransferase-isomerase
MELAALASMHISEFDYQLPAELIAQQPLEQRDASRMLLLNRDTQTWIDSQFALLPDYLRARDVLVLNNTRVFPARLIGDRDPSGGRVEVLLVRELEPLVWEALVRPGHRLKQGAGLRFGNSKLRAEMLDEPGDRLRLIRLESAERLETVLEELGQTPLPPYIKRAAGTSAADRERYQTVFAKEKGAIAAPTAGLHFTRRIIEEVLARGARVVEITLHIGYGTFEPVRVENVGLHSVAPEVFQIDEDAACMINAARSSGGRVIAVGTTTTRALESAVNSHGTVEPGAKTAHLTITPGYKFRVTDALLTNFHLPRSSLLLLVCAFARRDLILDAYRHAVVAGYRFYSYGDCTLVI